MLVGRQFKTGFNKYDMMVFWSKMVELQFFGERKVNLMADLLMCTCYQRKITNILMQIISLTPDLPVGIQ